MLKKQTVWLLTMLSLMIVLSIYYLTSPDSGDFAYLNDKEDTTEETAADSEGTNDTATVDELTNVGEDQLFTTIRMEMEDKRSELKERWGDVVASSTATIEEKNEAKNKMNQLDDISEKESILENSIIAAANYDDVLVRHDEDKVHVRVKVDEKPSNTEVVNIMQMVRDEFGDITVDVIHQPAES